MFIINQQTASPVQYSLHRGIVWHVFKQLFSGLSLEDSVLVNRHTAGWLAVLRALGELEHCFREVNNKKSTNF